MELLFLGTGAGVPSRQRNTSSLALKLLNELNEIWLFDCGEATQHQILKTSLKPRKISTIFITHLHGDHIFGLPGLLSSRSFQGGEDEVTIYGPPGIKEFVNVALRLSKSNLFYSINIVELKPEGGHFNLSQGWQVEYLPLNHGILSFGFRIIEPETPGELQVDKLKEFNIPSGPIYGQLKRGETVELDDGTLLHGKDFIAEPKPGRVITILGDTRPHKNLKVLAKDTTILVHEGTHADADEKMANQYYHSTNTQAAKLAKEVQAQYLYLNHISSRYLGNEVKKLEKEARRIFKNTTVVHDFDEFTIPSN